MGLEIGNNHPNAETVGLLLPVPAVGAQFCAAHRVTTPDLVAILSFDGADLQVQELTPTGEGLL